MELNKVLDQIKRSPLFHEFQKREQQEIIDKRQNLVEELKPLDEESMSIAKEYNAKINKVKSEIEKLEEKLEQKKRALHEIEIEHHNKSQQIRRKEATCLNALEKSAHSQIDEALSFFDKEAGRLRRIDGGPESEKTMKSIFAGRKELNQMKLEPVLDKKKLKNLLSGLPGNYKLAMAG